MTEAEVMLFDLNNAVQKELDDAARYWRREFYQMPVAQVAAERRDRAILAIQDAIDFFADGQLEDVDFASIIVDNSEFACLGFDALDTTPRTAVGRWLARWW